MGITSFFWYNEWKFSLPTPVPDKYVAVGCGQQINLPPELKLEKGKPLFLHFFNPTCPCSRFNIPHFRSLVRQYEDKIQFVVVVMSKDSSYSAGDIQNKFGLNIPILFDKSLAASCGVYSTPQAVLITPEHTLYYRGNYNKSRYCTDKKSNYAQNAIDSLLASKLNPVFEAPALTAYGCQLAPVCIKPLK